MAILCCCCLMSILFCGCHSTQKSASSSFASIEIRNKNPVQIRQAALDIFHEHDYKAPVATLAKMVFEKEGTTFDNASYGNWMGGTPIWIRIKLKVLPMAEDVYELQCMAFYVRDKGRAAFEEEIKVSNMRSRPYQKLLDEVAQRLALAQ